MATLTIFLAPDGPAAGVLDVLVDLSAAGLVSPFLWVADANVTADPRSADVQAVAVRDGIQAPATVGAALADSSADRRRLCVVVPLGAQDLPASSAVEQRLLSVVSFAGGNVPVTAIRALVGRQGDHAEDGLLDRAGWHNIYIAPEDARGPGEARVILGPIDNPVDIGRYAAPAIAGIVGLWRGNDRTPLDDDAAPPGVRAGRSFYRRIDASEMERALRRRVLSTEAPLPAPRDYTATAVHLDDAASAGRAVAERWWSRHRSALVGLRVNRKAPEPLPTGALALIKLFFRFIGARLRNAPGDWLAGLKTRAAAVAASAVQNAVLGAGDSAYQVVVRGVTDRGLPAGWREIGAASSVLDDHLVASGWGGHAQRPDLRQMWEDYAFGSLSLADAGRHGAIEPLRRDANPGVLRSTNDIAPPPDHDFTDIPGYLQAEVGNRVWTGDVLGAETARRKLQHYLEDLNQASAAGRTLQALNDWQTTHQNAYSVQVGGILARTLLETVAEIRSQLEWLARTAAEEAARREESPRRFVVWMTRILGVLAVLGVVAAPILIAREVLTIPKAVFVGLLPLVVWFVFLLVSFVREWREVFRDLHRRRELVSAVTAMKANLRQATIDMRRLIDAYEQYLMWSRVVGTVLQNPFGPTPEAGGAAIAITHGLPRTTRIAHAEVNETVVGFAADALRAELFVPGWLGKLWTTHLEGAGRELNRHDLVDDRWEGILDLRSGVAGSALAQWVDLLASRGTTAEAGEGVWSEVMRSLRGNRADLAQSLLASVCGVERTDQRSVCLNEFLAGIDQPLAWDHQFDAAHFTTQGRTEGRGSVAVHVPMQAQVGLSRIDVLVQLTAACPAWDFAVTVQPRNPWDPIPEPDPRDPQLAPPHPGIAEHRATGPIPRVQPDAVPQAPKGYR